jgi:hypothetical protein
MKPPGRAIMVTTRGLALVLSVCAAAPQAWAKGKASDDAAAASDDEDDVKIEDSPSEPGAKPAKTKKKASGEESGGGGLQKQDLNGHDLGTTKKENVFERDRFFVDKVDTAKTEKGTLVQGSLTSTSFAYHEAGGTLAAPMGSTAVVPSASPYNRLYTDLRLQTDFRHLGGGRWDARVDARGRVVTDPGIISANYVPTTNSTVQSGFRGKNELELKELWLVRNGLRSDLFFGRQFIPDLGGLRIDGLRVDYASSSKFTLLGFGGLYPLRGSRSITSDYTRLKSNPDVNGGRTAAGRFTGAAGFGAAYRTLDAYGSFGGVALVPLSAESPRVYGTSTGYWRYGTKLDLYHLAVVDLVGSNAVNAGLTNLSLGANYKPDQRLRGTLSFHRVDTETLNVQAQAYLLNPDVALNVLQNEAYLARIATNEARASLSAGLGELQRFEATAAVAYRRRGEVVISAPPQMAAGAVTTATLPAAQSVEVYGAITDRRSIKDLRLGLDASRTFGLGGASFQRSTSLSLRASAAHELSNGHGEWEAEVAYSNSTDDNAGTTCVGDLLTCLGASKSSVISLGGSVFYRINRDWFVIGSAFLNRTSITHVETGKTTDDPAVTGISGFFRAAYRF